MVAAGVFKNLSDNDIEGEAYGELKVRPFATIPQLR
jgi:hypothetical protein